MNKNPKMIAGIAGLALMLILAVVLIVQMIPTIGEVQREMSLTPTPLPPVPDSVRAAGFVEEETPEPALGTGSWGEKRLDEGAVAGVTRGRGTDELFDRWGR